MSTVWREKSSGGGGEFEISRRVKTIAEFDSGNFVTIAQMVEVPRTFREVVPS